MPDGRLVVTTHLRGEALAYRTELIDTRKAGRRVVIIADPLVRGALYASPGYLLYSLNDPNKGLWAVPFSGAPVDLAGSVRLASRVLVRYDAARDGTLVYESDEGRDNETEIVWVDRAGEVSAIPGAKFERSLTCCPALSFDGRRAALVTGSASVRNLVVRDLATGVDTRLTFQQSDVDGLGDYAPEPAWFPTGDRVVYATGAVGTPKVVVRPGDGSGDTDRLTAREASGDQRG